MSFLPDIKPYRGDYVINIWVMIMQKPNGDYFPFIHLLV